MSMTICSGCSTTSETMSAGNGCHSCLAGVMEDPNES